VFVSAIGGVYDLVAEVRLGTMPELHAVIEDIRAIPQVLDVNTLVYTSVVKGPFVSSYRGDVVLDETDTALIELLQEDGRISFRALGEVVRLSPSAVATRVQRLRAAHVIRSEPWRRVVPRTGGSRWAWGSACWATTTPCSRWCAPGPAWTSPPARSAVSTL
jgi:hypothetical protein